MAQVIAELEDPRSRIAEMLGMSLGKSLGNGVNTYFANQALDEVINDPTLKDAPVSKRMSRLQEALSTHGEYGRSVLQNRLAIEQQMQAEREQQVIGNLLGGGKVSQEDFSRLSPKTQMDVMRYQQQKATAEKKITTDQLASAAFGKGYQAILNGDLDTLKEVVADPNVPPGVKKQLSDIENQISTRSDVKARESRNRVQNVQSAYAKAIVAEKSRIGKMGGFTKQQVSDINKSVEELERMRQQDMQALLKNPESFGILQIWGDKRTRGHLPEEGFVEEGQSAPKMKFDPKNSQHIGRFEQLDKQYGGDRKRVNQELAKEFSL